jgi:hypothetical protein
MNKRAWISNNDQGNGVLAITLAEIPLQDGEHCGPLVRKVEASDTQRLQ